MNSDVITVAFGCDHAGFPLRQPVLDWLKQGSFSVIDFGTQSDARVDYPDFAHLVSRAVAGGRARFGVLICGTGVGMAIAANRHAEIRCAQATDSTTARLGRAHNDANVLALGARLSGAEAASDILRAFFATEFEGGRHINRLAKLAPV